MHVVRGVLSCGGHHACDQYVQAQDLHTFKDIEYCTGLNKGICEWPMRSGDLCEDERYYREDLQEVLRTAVSVGAFYVAAAAIVPIPLTGQGVPDDDLWVGRDCADGFALYHACERVPHEHRASKEGLRALRLISCSPWKVRAFRRSVSDIGLEGFEIRWFEARAQIMPHVDTPRKHEHVLQYSAPQRWPSTPIGKGDPVTCNHFQMHWHACAEFLLVSSSYGVVDLIAKQFTKRDPEKPEVYDRSLIDKCTASLVKKACEITGHDLSSTVGVNNRAVI